MFQNPFKIKLLPEMEIISGSNPQTITTNLLYHFCNLSHGNGAGHFNNLVLRSAW